MEKKMSIKGEVTEAAGFIKKEANEHGKSPKNHEKAQKGRDLRNVGRGKTGRRPKPRNLGQIIRRNSSPCRAIL
jgi:hypothetical protein